VQPFHVDELTEIQRPHPRMRAASFYISATSSMNLRAMIGGRTRTTSRNGHFALIWTHKIEPSPALACLLQALQEIT
jgi:hypothetical protein